MLILSIIGYKTQPNRGYYCRYNLFKKLKNGKKEINEFINKHETIHYKNYCRNDKICEYFLNPIIHECQFRGGYNFTHIYRLLFKFVGNQPSLMDANLLPYRHDNDSDSVFVWNEENVPIRSVVFVLFCFVF